MLETINVLLTLFNELIFNITSYFFLYSLYPDLHMHELIIKTQVWALVSPRGGGGGGEV